jgi:hypothetical protein
MEFLLSALLMLYFYPVLCGLAILFSVLAIVILLRLRIKV